MMRVHLGSLLRAVGRAVPDVRYARAIPTRLLRPLNIALDLPAQVVDVLGFKMALDPKECVDSALWFQPHLYDAAELSFLKDNFDGGVFIDLGANIGLWSLYVAHNFPGSRILAIEANPNTFASLNQNIALNRFSNLRAYNIGIADRRGVLPLYLNETGNRGGDSLNEQHSDRRSIDVPVETLTDFVANNGIDRISFMKLDIEGMETAVLKHFFENAPDALHPQMMCVETLHSTGLEALICDNGYRVACVGRDNKVFERAR